MQRSVATFPAAGLAGGPHNISTTLLNRVTQNRHRMVRDIAKAPCWRPVGALEGPGRPATWRGDLDGCRASWTRAAAGPPPAHVHKLYRTSLAARLVARHHRRVGLPVGARRLVRRPAGGRGPVLAEGGTAAATGGLCQGSAAAKVAAAPVGAVPHCTRRGAPAHQARGGPAPPLQRLLPRPLGARWDGPTQPGHAENQGSAPRVRTPPPLPARAAPPPPGARGRTFREPPRCRPRRGRARCASW